MEGSTLVLNIGSIHELRKVKNFILLYWLSRYNLLVLN